MAADSFLGVPPSVDNFDLGLKMLKIVGIWLLESGEDGRVRRTLRTAHALYCVLITCLIYIPYPIFQIIDCAQAWGNLKDVTENVCISMIHLGGAFKLINILIKKRDVIACMDAFNFKMMEVSSANNRPDHKLAAMKLKLLTKQKSDRVTAGFLALVLSTGMACAVYPLTNMNEFGSRFPYRAYLPLWSSSPVPRYLYQVAAIIFYGILILQANMLFVSFVINLTAQTSVLCHALRAIGEPSGESIDMLDNTAEEYEPSDLVLLRNKNRTVTCSRSAETNDAIYLNLKRCIIHHQHILRLANNIETLFSNVILIQFFVSIMGLCMAGFQICACKFDSVFIVMLAYFSCVLTEILLYCWFANEFTIQSDKIREAAYGCHWIGLEVRVRRALLIIISRATRPVAFTAGRFFSLSLDTFVQIISKAYSILTVLRNFIEPEQ